MALLQPKGAQFPLISRMAIDRFSIPAMLSEAEPVLFSGPKRQYIRVAGDLKSNTMEAIGMSHVMVSGRILSRGMLLEVVRQQEEEEERLESEDLDL